MFIIFMCQLYIVVLTTLLSYQCNVNYMSSWGPAPSGLLQFEQCPQGLQCRCSIYLHRPTGEESLCDLFKPLIQVIDYYHYYYYYWSLETEYAFLSESWKTCYSNHRKVLIVPSLGLCGTAFHNSVWYGTECQKFLRVGSKLVRNLSSCASTT